MVFMGDLEQEGFNAMTSATTCCPALFDSNYYTILHHSSTNGHSGMPCQKLKLPKPSPLNCVVHNKLKTLLMGRNRAYKGICGPIAIAFWNGLPGVGNYSEHASHYLYLDWGNGKSCLSLKPINGLFRHDTKLK